MQKKENSDAVNVPNEPDEHAVILGAADIPPALIVGAARDRQPTYVSTVNEFEIKRSELEAAEKGARGVRE